MRREDLEHLVRAAGTILDVEELIVVGSQSILASVPEGLPPEATRSIEADLVPPDDPDGFKADLVDGSIGEGSMFQETFGYYAQGVSESTSRLPAGWRDRLVRLRNQNTRGVTAWCLEPHDLAVAKLVAGRPKDIEFVGALLSASLIDAAILEDRLAHTDLEGHERDRLVSLLRSM